jgi:hypothetical protein
MSMPNRRSIGESVGAARNLLPSPERAGYFGGLAVKKTVELIEWPVAVVIGVGTALAGRGSSERSRDETVAAGDIPTAVDSGATTQSDQVRARGPKVKRGRASGT